MRSTEKVRITAQLIDARSDQHLLADRYERDLSDVFSLQDEVARKIASRDWNEPDRRTSKKL